MLNNQKNFKGAYVSIQWLDDDGIIEGYYISFDKPPLEDEPLDDNVFYYCDNVEDLERLTQLSNCLDFIVLDYELVEASTC